MELYRYIILRYITPNDIDAQKLSLNLKSHIKKYFPNVQIVLETNESYWKDPIGLISLEKKAYCRLFIMRILIQKAGFLAKSFFLTYPPPSMHCIRKSTQDKPKKLLELLSRLP